MNDEQAEWAEAKKSHQSAPRRSMVERRRGFAFLIAALAAFIVFCIGVAIGSSAKNERLGRGIGALGIPIFWLVRRTLRPKTIFEEEPTRPT